MPPRPFYSIPESSYLFGRKNTPEEEVRQWALFELLGTYKWPITSLQIELPVQIGTRIFRADIAILDNSIPLAVVECKRRDYNFGAKDFRQGYSYADSLQAQFVVLTNGKDWLTFRKIGGGWGPVSDVPRLEQQYLIYRTEDLTSHGLHRLLWSFHSLQSLLYWLYRPVPKEDIIVFARNLDVFFQYTDFAVNYQLKYVVYYLCAYLGTERFFEDSQDDYDCYAAHKLSRLCRELHQYLKTKDGRQREKIEARELNARQALLWIRTDIDELLQNSVNLSNSETLIGQFIVSLANYLGIVFEKKAFSEWEGHFIQPFWNLVDTEFLQRFGVLLPKSHDDENVNIMRGNGQHVVRHDVVDPFFK